ncbi:sodium-translocating pyrophosphatase [Candidatus Saccharibacteria bacterium]|nr:sodium-translocating pyrophosphatase [Candidatus Saccharibacteria bacterium]
MTLTWILLAVAIAGAIYFIVETYLAMKKKSEGNPDMVEMGQTIRSGADTFVKREFSVITVVVIIVALAYSFFIEKFAGVTLLIGAAMSSAACILGMKTATYSNVRTVNAALTTRSIGKTVKVALEGGSICGIAVQGLGLLGLGLCLVIFGMVDRDAVGTGILTGLKCNPTIVRLTAYSLGCSLVAMFNRVAGGNYTKAADISSDILAKIRHDLPEDDAKVPNVIADFIGDNVNDIAGNCSDLLESFVATVVAAMIIPAAVLTTTDEALFLAMIRFPLLLAGVGLLACVGTLFYAQRREMTDDPEAELNLATYFSAGLIVAFGLVASLFVFRGQNLPEEFALGAFSPWVSAVLGIASGVAIGALTEHYTSFTKRPTMNLAKIAKEGEAFVITKGDAIGSRSTLLPVLVIGVALLFSGKICGTYGIAIAALGMLSFVGTTVSIDAFGPIADNAGGIAESCHLDPEVRVITDKLDAVGNTTAAIGKGFAIGSAAFATVSLIYAYIGNFTAFGETPDLNLANFVVVAGAIVGGALIEYFSALLTDHTIESARAMADVGDAQLSEPGVLEGTKKPNYNEMIDLATKLALKKMLGPSVISLLVSIVAGLLFGPMFVGGILVGATIVAITRALFMGNSGGAFDNAKKAIESGLIEGEEKGSAAHKAAVVGDTVGDTRKDVVGVALDIFIKSMSTVANTFAAVIKNVSLFK